MDISDFDLPFSRIRWRIAGLGMVRMLVRYFPDKMWLRGNMDRWGKNSIYFAHIYQFLRAAPSWYDGISTFHVGGESDLFTFRNW